MERRYFNRLTGPCWAGRIAPLRIRGVSQGRGRPPQYHKSHLASASQKQQKEPMRFLIKLVLVLAVMLYLRPTTPINKVVPANITPSSVTKELPQTPPTQAKEEAVHAVTAQVVTVPSDPKAIAKAKAEQRGWTGHQWQALEELWHYESGWNPNAKNPSSGACGIVQAWPCSKIPNPSDVHSQIDWGITYIADRYGSPASALAFWHSQYPHWY